MLGERRLPIGRVEANERHVIFGQLVAAKEGAVMLHRRAIGVEPRAAHYEEGFDGVRQVMVPLRVNQRSVGANGAVVGDSQEKVSVKEGVESGIEAGGDSTVRARARGCVSQRERDGKQGTRNSI